MRILSISIFLTTSIICAGQINFYSENIGGSLQTIDGVEYQYKMMKGSVHMRNKCISPIIYHKEFRNDSIINYIRYSVRPKDQSNCEEFKILFRQDSLFLLLGEEFPVFELEDLEGALVKTSQLLGKPSLINLSATYCSACLQEIPVLNELKAKYGKKANFISIADVSRNNCDYIVYEKYNFSFRILKNNDLYKKDLHVSSLPYNIILDPKGKVVHVAKGAISQKQFTDILDSLLIGR